jgi:dihydrofolate reductase
MYHRGIDHKQRRYKMKIVVTEFISLDGVVGEPQEWSFPYWSEETGNFKLEELRASDAQLLGRITYEGFASAWPAMEKDPAGFADKMNSMPKYVVSTTLKKADWENSTIINKNVVDEITKLKSQSGGDVLVAGSVTLIHTLMEHDLVDEYRLLTYPIVLGKGKRLFSDGTAASLQLTESKPMGSGVVLLRYAPAKK